MGDSLTAERTGVQRVDNDELDLSRYMRALGRGWIALSLALALGGLAGWIVASRTPRLYEASVVLSVIARTDGQAPMTPAAIRTVLSSPALATAVVGDSGTDGTASGVTAQSLASALSIEEIPGTGWLRVKVRLVDPELSAKIANRFAERALDFSSRIVDADAAAERDQLRRQLDAVATRLKAAEDRVTDFKKRSQMDVLRADVDGLLRQQEDWRWLGRAEDGRKPPSAATQTELSRKLNDLYVKETELNRLMTEVDISQGTYLDIGARYERAVDRLSAAGPVLRIIDRAIPSDQPVPRGRIRSTVLGALAALFATVALLVFREARRIDA